MRSLRAQAAGGVKSTGASALLIGGIQLIQLAILAHLLPPSDFGLMGMVNIVVGLGAIVAEAGLGKALIQRKHPSPESLSTLYWTNVATGAGLFLIVVAVAGPVAVFFGDTRLAGPLALSGFLLLIAPWGQLYLALMEKDLRFRELAWIEVLASAVGLIIAVSMALAGMRVFSLVWGALAATAARTTGMICFGGVNWRPRMCFVARSLDGYLAFGLYHTGQRLVNYTTSNIDFLLVGKLFGARPLGFYGMAYNLANLPASRLNPVLSRVFFPVFARYGDDVPRLRRGYLKMQAASSLANVPLLLGLLALAPVAIPVVLGEPWRPATTILQVLCVVGLARSIAGTVGPLILARGRTDLGFRWSLLVVAIQVPALYAGARVGGVLGVAIAFAIVMILLLALNYVILVRTLVGSCLRGYAESVWPFLWKGIVMAGVVFAFGWLTPVLPDPVVLGIQILGGAATYLTLVWLRQRDLVLELRALLLSKDTA